MYISGKDKLGYINGDYPQPPEIDPSFCKWRTENVMVKGWLFNSMDHSLVVNFIPGGSIEKYYNNLQGLWRVINFSYAYIRMEDLRQSVMVSGAEALANGAIMAIKGVKSGHSNGNKCTHCGSTKHTRETCFKLHGYPDWWHELQA
ncbi:hypothetical protein AAG906_013134 [Vitis piasezkii]